jgi:hypothetical protein
LAARPEAGVRVRGSGASQDITADRAGRATPGFDQAAGRSSAAAIKVPLAEAPRAYQRSPAAIPRDPSGDASARAVERSPSRQGSPWYGQQATPWYGGRTAQPMTPNDPAAASAIDGQRRAYSRGPVGAPAVPVAPRQMPIAPAAPQGAVPRWGPPSAVQRAQPIYAPPASVQPSAPPSPVMRAPAASAPVPVPRGAAPSLPPSASPAAAPAREAAPRHAPSSRRPS